MGYKIPDTVKVFGIVIAQTCWETQYKGQALDIGIIANRVSGLNNASHAHSRLCTYKG